VINLGTNNAPQNANLGKKCSLAERKAFIKLFKEYNDIFSCTYDELKTYDHKDCPTYHPNEPSNKSFLAKVEENAPKLGASSKRIIKQAIGRKNNIPIGHTQYISNLVHMRKNNGRHKALC
jgi:hypothetical protein